MHYYNENDPKAAAWLRELVAAGEIPKGHVDDRSILDVKPRDLAGFGQCHFFAGVGGWALALKLAGMSKKKGLWTGSCPCQPFSNAGQRKGFKDERHLWPVWFELIRKCRPERVVGEQVASKAALAWIDAVQTDLEGAGYAFGAVDLCTAGVGSPHIRQRLYWMADNGSNQRGSRRTGQENARPEAQPAGCGNARWVALANGRHPCPEGLQRGRQHGQRAQDSGAGGLAISQHRGRPGRDTQGQGSSSAVPSGAAHRLGHARPAGLQACQRQALEQAGRREEGRAALQPGQALGGLDNEERPGPVNGLWRDADWLFCTDGRWRPVERSTFPLVDGSARSVVSGGDPSPQEVQSTSEARVMRLRGYGNAIVIPLAVEFLGAVEEAPG